MRFRLLLILALLAPAVAHASDFVNDGTSIPSVKTDLRTDTTPASKKITASDWGAYGDAIYSLRTALQGGQFHGLSLLSSAPAAPASGLRLFTINDGNGVLRLRAIKADGTAEDLTGFVAPFSGAKTRTIASKLADTFNVADFGTLGTADDSATIQAALNAAAASSAPTPVVKFPAGTYYAKNLSITAAMHIEGEGRDRTVLKLPAEGTGVGYPMFLVTSGGVQFHKLTIDGNKAAQAADGFSDSFANPLPGGIGRSYRAGIKVYVASTDLSDIVIEDCGFKNMYGAAIATWRTSKLKVRRNLFNSNNFESLCAYSDKAAGQFDNDVEFSDNETHNVGSGDAFVNGDSIVLHQVSGFVVANNLLDTVERDFVKLESCEQGTVSNNVVSNNSIDSYGAIQLATSATSVSITGNKILNFGAGIRLDVAGAGEFRNISITGNVIDTTKGPSTGDGILCTNGSTGHEQIAIVGNIIKGTERHGIFFGGQQSNLTISGNTVKLSGTNTAAVGIYLVADGADWDRVAVTGNSIDATGSQQGGIRIQNASGHVMKHVIIQGNTAIVGASAQPGIVDATTAIQSGIVAGNYTDGFGVWSSTGIAFAENNTFGGGSSAAGMMRVVTALGQTPPQEQMTNTDKIVGVNLTVAGPSTITTPIYGTALVGKVFTVKDMKGDAATNNITIAPSFNTIDGAANVKITTNYGKVSFYTDGTNWFTL